MKNDAVLTVIRTWLKEHLTPERYRHTLGTYRVAMKLAKRYGADGTRTALAALLHDAGRSFSTREAMLAYCRTHGEIVPAHKKRNRGLLHASAGAAVARIEFGIRDTTVLNAIRHHTTGEKKMSLIAKIIYIADVLDPGRGLPHTRGLIRKAVNDIDAAFIDVLIICIGYVLSKQEFLAPESVECYNAQIER